MKRCKSSYEDALAAHDSFDRGDKLEDAVHRHFEELSPAFDDWCSVAEEGRRLWSVMFNEPLEPYSPIDCVISGATGAGYSLAISQVAKRLGISEIALECGIESQDEPGVAGFLSECQKYNNPQENPRP